MKTTCPSCQTRYAIPDERVVGRVLKVRCKKCKEIMKVVGPTAAFDPDMDHRPPTLTGVRPYRVDGPSLEYQTGAPVWWAGIHGKPHGPYTPEELHALVRRGDITGRTFLWRGGMSGWQRICESSQLTFAYEWVLEELGHMPASTRSHTDVFDLAGIVSDGQSYFPDPTLKSGWIILDERTQSYLETVAEQRAQRRMTKQSSPERRAHLGATFALGFFGVMFAAVGAVWLSQMAFPGV